MKPALQLIPKAPASPEINWAEVERNTASVAELAALLRITERGVRLRIERGVYRTYQVPSRLAPGRLETRVILSDDLHKRIRKARRRAEREQSGIPRKRGVVLDPENDRRLAFTTEEEKLVQGLWLERTQPSVAHVFDQAVARCIRCRRAPLSPTMPGYRGRYAIHRCASCGFELAYSAVRRAVMRTPRPAAVLGREGINSFVNKHGTYARLAHLPWHRNEQAYGDHHQLDILVYDPREPFLKNGEARLYRPWLSAWQDKATCVVAWRIGEHANAALLSLAFRSYVLQ